MRAPDEMAIGPSGPPESGERPGDARKPWVKPQITSCDLNDTEFSPHGPFVDNSLFS